MEEWQTLEGDWCLEGEPAFSKESILKIYENATTRGSINFHAVVSSNPPWIKSYDFCKILYDQTEHLVKLNNSGQFWILTNPKLAFVLQQFQHFKGKRIIPIGLENTQHLGILCRRWHLFESIWVPSGFLLLGVGKILQSFTSYARINIWNPPT